MNDLYRSMFLPDLLIAALERNRDRPAVFIDGEVLTAADFRDEISRYVQVFREQGVVQGDGVATLSTNRPEVLFTLGANLMIGAAQHVDASARLARRPRVRRSRTPSIEHADLRRRQLAERAPNCASACPT